MGVANRWKEILLAEDSPADADLLRISLRNYGRLPCRLHVEIGRASCRERV